ncbi:MAG: NUDIX domain-containing protein [Bacillota bacterium]
MVKKERMIDRRRIFTGRIISFREDLVELPDGKETTREVVEHPGAVAVVALDKAGRLILVCQYRYPLERETLEIPAGKLDPGEDPEECARRELKEETGYDAVEIRYLLSFYTSPGFTDEIIHLFSARAGTCTGPHTDEDEFVDIRLYEPAELMEMVKKGAVCDAKTILGLLYAKEAGLFPA